jgi:hypothetical protein
MLRMRALYGLVATVALAAGAAAADSPTLAITPSAQVTLAGSATAAGLTLRARPTAAGPLNISAMSITLDGASAPATRQGDGSWYAPLPPAPPGGKAGPAPGKLEILVVHDGIREVLNGTLHSSPIGATAPTGGGLLHDHKQLSWWILNIAIVLIAAIAISRRTS